VGAGWPWTPPKLLGGQDQPGRPGVGRGQAPTRAYPTFASEGLALSTGIIPLLWWLTPADYTTTALRLLASENRLQGERGDES